MVFGCCSHSGDWGSRWRFLYSDVFPNFHSNCIIPTLSVNPCWTWAELRNWRCVLWRKEQGLGLLVLQHRIIQTPGKRTQTRDFWGLSTLGLLGTFEDEEFLSPAWTIIHSLASSCNYSLQLGTDKKFRGMKDLITAQMQYFMMRVVNFEPL